MRCSFNCHDLPPGLAFLSVLVWLALGRGHYLHCFTAGQSVLSAQRDGGIFEDADCGTSNVHLSILLAPLLAPRFEFSERISSLVL